MRTPLVQGILTQQARHWSILNDEQKAKWGKDWYVCIRMHMRVHACGNEVELFLTRLLIRRAAHRQPSGERGRPLVFSLSNLTSAFACAHTHMHTLTLLLGGTKTRMRLR
jgi:hypothetical protein